MTVVDKASGKLSSRSFALQYSGGGEVFSRGDGRRPPACPETRLEGRVDHAGRGLRQLAQPRDDGDVPARRALCPLGRQLAHLCQGRSTVSRWAISRYVRAGARREGMGWRDPRMETRFQRDKHDRECSPERWRSLVEQALVCGYRGQGRIGADFWHVVLPGGRGEEEMDNRAGCSGWTGNLMLNCSSARCSLRGPTGRCPRPASKPCGKASRTARPASPSRRRWRMTTCGNGWTPTSSGGVPPNWRNVPGSSTARRPRTGPALGTVEPRSVRVAAEVEAEGWQPIGLNFSMTKGPNHEDLRVVALLVSAVSAAVLACGAMRCFAAEAVERILGRPLCPASCR